jgi:hypothetical protein
MAKPAPFLIVGNVYEVFTKRESIFGEITKVVSIVSYEEAQKIRYSMNVLALQEKVIPTTDESLDVYLKTQNLYHLRAVQASKDGVYTEYIVWDDIIDKDRTHQMNVTHVYNAYISLDNGATVSVNQIITDMTQFVNTKYGNQMSFVMSRHSSLDNGEEDADMTTEQIRQKQLDEAMDYIGLVSKFFVSGLPAIEKFAQMDLSGKYNAIQDDLASIKQDVATISANIK